MQNKLDSKLLDLLLSILASIEYADGDAIDEDFAVKMLEFVRSEFESMNETEKRLLMEKLSEIKSSFDKEKRKFVEEFLKDLM